MNIHRLAILLALCVAVLCGCASAPSGAPSERSDTVAAIVRPVSKNLVTVVLSNNPDKSEALLALAGVAETAALGSDLTPASIKAFVDTFADRWKLTPQERLYVASAIDDLVKLYLDTYGKQVVSTLDPNVVKYLRAFAAGIRDGVEFHRAMTAA